MSGTNEIRVTNAKTGGEKGSKDENLALLPWEQLLEVGRLYNFGAKKYAPNNWMKGYDWSLSFSSLMRHAVAWWNGEFDDAETECDHMTSVVFHALALMYFRRHHPDLDDRPCTTLAAAQSIPGHVHGEAEVSFTFTPTPMPSYEDVLAAAQEGNEELVETLARAKAALPEALRSLIRLTTIEERTPNGHSRELVTVEPKGVCAVFKHVSGSGLTGPDDQPLGEYRVFTGMEAPTGYRFSHIEGGTGGDSAPENPLDGRSGPLEPSEPLSGTLPGSAHEISTLVTADAAERPESAVVDVPIRMTLAQWRTALEDGRLPVTVLTRVER